MTYIFDFDGTLVDSMPTFSKMMVRIFEENNLNYPEDVVKIITPLGYVGTANYAKSLGADLTVDEFIRIATEYMAFEYHNNIPAKKHVREKLIDLKKQGHSLNVLTASPHSVLDKCLQRLDMYDLFDNVWSCDDFGCSKAETKIYTAVAQKLNKDVKECCFADDNANAIATAKKAGMFVIGVYDPSSKEFVDEMKEIADKYIYDFSEL